MFSIFFLGKKQGNEVSLLRRSNGVQTAVLESWLIKRWVLKMDGEAGCHGWRDVCTAAVVAHCLGWLPLQCCVNPRGSSLTRAAVERHIYGYTNASLIPTAPPNHPELSNKYGGDSSYCDCMWEAIPGGGGQNSFLSSEMLVYRSVCVCHGDGWRN